MSYGQLKAPITLLLVGTTISLLIAMIEKGQSVCFKKEMNPNFKNTLNQYKVLPSAMRFFGINQYDNSKHQIEKLQKLKSAVMIALNELYQRKI